jgi:hypothetical protein
MFIIFSILFFFFMCFFINQFLWNSCTIYSYKVPVFQKTQKLSSDEEHMFLSCIFLNKPNFCETFVQFL